MGKEPVSKSAARAAQELQYSLRSSFLYRRRKPFKIWLRQVRLACRRPCDWSDLENLGISRAAWHSTQTKGVKPSQVFCHPEIIARTPGLAGYYRCIAGLPQKGTQRLVSSTRPLEEGRTKVLSSERAAALARLFNRYMSAAIESEPDFSLEDALLVGMMNFGAQINGSWRNAIGAEGGLRVRRLLLSYLADNRLVAEIMSKSGERLRWPLSESQLPEVQRVRLSNGYEIVFGSEPDVSVLDKMGTLQAAIEVKAGKDPAGALERYGAAKKSFDRALRRNKSAVTVYLADCITPAVKKAIQTDRLVTRDFDLTQVLLRRGERDDFLAYVKWLLRL